MTPDQDSLISSVPFLFLTVNQHVVIKLSLQNFKNCDNFTGFLVGQAFFWKRNFILTGIIFLHQNTYVHPIEVTLLSWFAKNNCIQSVHVIGPTLKLLQIGTNLLDQTAEIINLIFLSYFSYIKSIFKLLLPCHHARKKKKNISVFPR